MYYFKLSARGIPYTGPNRWGKAVGNMLLRRRDGIDMLPSRRTGRDGDPGKAAKIYKPNLGRKATTLGKRGGSFLGVAK